MLLKDKDQLSEQSLLRPRDDSQAGPSAVPPPSFEESAGHIVIDINGIVDAFPTGGEEPPEFTPYEAEHWVSKNGEIISHDPHLNEDDFLIQCRGTHSETHTRLVDKTDSRGRRYTDTEHYTENVTDFDFTIEYQVPPRATQWTVGDEEPAYRGHMSREVGPPGETTKADRATRKAFESWLVKRNMRGLPPWVGSCSDRLEEHTDFQTGAVQQPRPTDVLKSSRTLRQWADDYCQSRKIFKEFVYEKVVYGWDLKALEAAIRATIASTHYRGDNVHVRFKSRYKTVIVRPDGRISRAISNPWLKFLLIITLIYPFIWLFKRFHSRGGGSWAVGGGAYALKRWALLRDNAVPGTLAEIHDTVEGPRILVGEREGQWFKRWEGTIRRSVVGRKVNKTPMQEPDDEVINWPATELDGF